MFLFELLDDVTLMIIQTLFEVIIASIFIFTFPIYKKKYLNVFKYGFLLRGLGFLLIGLRSVTPLWLTVIVANTVLQAGFYINLYAFYMMIGQKIKKRYYVGLNVVHFILFLFYTFVNPDVGVRIVIYSIIQIIPIFHLLHAYGKRILCEKDIIKGTIIGLYSGMILTNALRVYQVLITGQINQLFRNEWVTKLAFLYTLMFSFLRVYMIFLYVAKEYQEELIEVNYQLEVLSYKDNLTGLNNNRAIMGIIFDEVERSKRYGHKTSIALIDIDDFKHVNDTYGHIFGDEVLKKLADIFMETARSSDAVGRYGGEEFIIVMAETSNSDGKTLITRIKNQVNAVVWDKAPDLRVSFSAGIYEVGESTDVSSIRQLVDEADKIMYEAKRNGKDRIEIG